MKPTAILTMDIEDWYHLDYFNTSKCNVEYSLLDGLDIYRELLDNYKIKSSFFVVGEIADHIDTKLRKLKKEGHEIGIHGLDHSLPMKLTLKKFKENIKEAKNRIENAIDSGISGYRAPCFSLDSERLKCVEQLGILYDSSRIDFGPHPLYENLDVSDFEIVTPNIFRKDNFFEFEVSTHKILNRSIPISGGGYLRIFPWLFTRKMIESYLKNNNLFVFYIHPFELSLKGNPDFPQGTSFSTRMRFGLGRKTVKEKLNSLIKMLLDADFRFITFSELREEIILN